MGTMTPAHGTFTPLRPMDPLQSPLVPQGSIPQAMPRTGLAVAGPTQGVMDKRSMQKSFSATSLQPSASLPPQPSVVASPFVKHRVDYTTVPRPGKASPPVPPGRLVWPFDRAVGTAPSPGHPPRSQTPQPVTSNISIASPSPSPAWPGKSTSPLGGSRRPALAPSKESRMQATPVAGAYSPAKMLETKAAASPGGPAVITSSQQTMVTSSHTAFGVNPPSLSYPHGYVATIQRSGSVKHLPF